MRAIQLSAPSTITLTDVPAPDLPDGEVLVKMQSLSLCGSDMGPYREVAPEEEYPMLPGLPSHECAGAECTCAAELTCLDVPSNWIEH